jgi:hypothetical protein
MSVGLGHGGILGGMIVHYLPGWTGNSLGASLSRPRRSQRRHLTSESVDVVQRYFVTLKSAQRRRPHIPASITPDGLVSPISQHAANRGNCACSKNLSPRTTVGDLAPD